MVSSTVLVTIIFSVSLGIISAYGAIQGILHAFARHPRQAEEVRPALVAQEAAAEQG
jgi:hypothetical protein